MVFGKLREYRVVPVVAVDSVDDGLKLCEALLAGGLPVAEITFRTAAAEAVIRAASQQFPDMILGAGTVLTSDQAQRAADAGAKFAVAPGFNPVVVAAARRAGLPFAPGVCTPPTSKPLSPLAALCLNFSRPRRLAASPC